MAPSYSQRRLVAHRNKTLYGNACACPLSATILSLGRIAFEALKVASSIRRPTPNFSVRADRTSGRTIVHTRAASRDNECISIAARECLPISELAMFAGRFDRCVRKNNDRAMAQSLA